VYTAHFIICKEKWNTCRWGGSFSFHIKNWDLISCELKNFFTQFTVYIHHLFYRKYYISYCLCAGLVELQLIPQVHYVNNATSLNNSHVIQGGSNMTGTDLYKRTHKSAPVIFEPPCTYNFNMYRTMLQMVWDLYLTWNANVKLFNFSLHVTNNLLA
jgi:hypothetical protein